MRLPDPPGTNRPLIASNLYMHGTEMSQMLQASAMTSRPTHIGVSVVTSPASLAIFS